MRLMWEEEHEVYVEDEEDDDNDGYQTVTKPQGMIVPDCCEAAREYPLVYLAYAWGDLSDEPYYKRFIPEGTEGWSSAENGWKSDRDRWVEKWLEDHPEDREDPPTMFDTATPKWSLNVDMSKIYIHLYPSQDEYFQHLTKRPPITHCPYCGAELPEVERIPNPPPTHSPVADGDYCGTCDERSRNCQCLDPVLAWQTKKRSQGERPQTAEVA